VERILLVQLFQLRKLEKKKENGMVQKIKRPQERRPGRRNMGRIKASRKLRLKQRGEM
ncbi:MAG: hypothetical protein ACI90V_001117, partial [Bacillariaceae sp.]|jgi:hypothetical protein